MKALVVNHKTIELKSGQEIPKPKGSELLVNLMKGQKTHQEFITINPDYIAHMPDNLSFEEAAALPLGALTSFVALREIGRVSKGSRVLINGASGGLGVYAIQLAKIFGASATAIAGGGQEAFLRSLGADRVINYQEQSIETLDGVFDVVLDLSNKKLFKDIQHLLGDKGIFIPAEPNKHVLNILLSPFSKKKTKYLMVDRGDHQKLSQIADWVRQDKLKVFVDSVYEFEDYKSAFERLQVKGKQGRVGINISQT